MPALTAREIGKTFAGRPVLRDVGFSVERGAFLFLLGPSGCGKTTLLRVIAGLLAPDAGSLEIDGKVANDPRVLLPPERRGVAMVFQHDALWPHMRVIDHLRFAGASRDEARKLLERVRLDAPGMDRRFPASLSGGERQRLSLARALASHPSLLLLDEPTRNLDRPLATALRREFAAVLREAGVTVVFVTHDPAEALAFADRIVLLGANGTPCADAPAEELFAAPPNQAAAAILGFGPAIDSRVGADGRVPTPLGAFASALPAGSPCVAVFRGTDLRAHDPDDASAATAPALVRASRFAGTHRLLDVEAGGQLFSVTAPLDARYAAGDRVLVAHARPPLFFPPNGDVP